MSNEIEEYHLKKLKIEADKKDVNKTKYLLLALLLGFIGIHKFYAKKTNIGLLYLILSFTFIPLFMSLYDFFVALKIKADENGNIRI